MRHRRHTPTRTPTRRLRASAGLPCAAALAVAVLTGAAPAQEAQTDGQRGAATVHEDRREAKSPDRPGSSRTAPPHGSTPAAEPYGTGGYGQYGAGDSTLFDPRAHPGREAGVPAGREPGSDPSPAGGRPATTTAGEVSPVLPLGAGMTLIGLGFALTAVGLRRA